MYESISSIDELLNPTKIQQKFKYQINAAADSESEEVLELSDQSDEHSDDDSSIHQVIKEVKSPPRARKTRVQKGKSLEAMAKLAGLH